MSASIVEYEAVEAVSLKGKSSPVPAWLALSASAPPGERRAKGQPFVGRNHELGLLQRIWDQSVAEQRPHVVTVFGPAGIGKSRLADTGLEPEAIVGTAEGNPLFIEELAAAVSEQGGDGTGNLPTSIRAIVAARLDSLPSDERSVLLDASVALSATQRPSNRWR